MRRWLRGLGLGLMGLASPLAVAFAQVAPPPAQVPPPLDLPSERPQEVPYAEEGTVEPEGGQTPGEVAPDLRLTLRRVRIVGNTVLPEALLQELARPYVGRALGQAELEELRLTLSNAYVERGYRTSGAILPDQTLAGGELRVRIVEGRVAELRLAGNERTREIVLRSRLWPDPDAPLHVPTLSRRLSLLQAEPSIESVDAVLKPTAELGQSLLMVRIIEANPLEASLSADNQRPPSIGPYSGTVRAGLQSPLGLGEHVRLRAQVSEGLRDVGGSLSLPLPDGRTRFTLASRYSESEVVETPFDVLEIESDFLSLSVGVERTVFESVRDRASVGLRFAWRRGRTTLLGEPFSFSEGVDEGESVVAPLRLDATWAQRERHEVRALRSTLSVGLPILGATDVAGAAADGSFVTWIVQGQWSRRFETLHGLELVARGDLQLASSPLLPLERFSLGGRTSVRGFRENQIVRDQGVAGSLELRVPVWRRPDGSPVVQLAPFLDGGAAWDHRDREDTRSKGLVAAGLGLRVFPIDTVRGELYWGQRMTKATRPRDDKDAQDYGVHFRLTAQLP